MAALAPLAIFLGVLGTLAFLSPRSGITISVAHCELRRQFSQRYRTGRHAYRAAKLWVRATIGIGAASWTASILLLRPGMLFGLVLLLALLRSDVLWCGLVCAAPAQAAGSRNFRISWSRRCVRSPAACASASASVRRS